MVQREKKPIAMMSIWDTDLANTIPDERLLNSFQKESAPITLKSIGKVLNDITEGV